MSLSNKIDFALIIDVKNANPNGDPLMGNRPRTDFEGFGEMSDVCLKRKIRDRLQDAGEEIFVQSDDRKTDDMPSLRHRAESEDVGLGKGAFTAKADTNQTIRRACEKWFDVRAFGQIFAYKGKGKGDGVSIPIRGPISLQPAFSTKDVSISEVQITKSVSGEVEANSTKRASDTMGMKYRVDDATYISYGAMNPQLAQRTGFSDDDAEAIKNVLSRLFEGDASSARPEGSMSVRQVVWWQHNSALGQYSSAKVHDSLRNLLDDEGKFDASALSNALDGLQPQVIEGF